MKQDLFSERELRLAAAAADAGWATWRLPNGLGRRRQGVRRSADNVRPRGDDF